MNNLHAVRGVKYGEVLHAAGVAQLNQLSTLTQVSDAIRALASFAADLPATECALLVAEACQHVGSIKLVPSPKKVIEAEVRAARQLAKAYAAQREEVAPTTEDATDRPQIAIGPDLHRVIDEAGTALARDPAVYQRDSKLVRVVHVAEAEAEAERECMAPGSPQLRSLDSPTLKERLSAAARFVAFDGRSGAWKHKTPPADVVSGLAARAEWPGIRPVTGVIETPSMRPDGSVIDIPGFDAATAYVYAPQCEYPRLPTSPSIDDARRALRDLQEPWQDFPVTSDAGRTVPVAAVLTLVGRPAIVGSVPGIFFDASTRGSGKSLQAKCVSTIAHGRECSVTTWPNGDDSELEKVLGAYALRGASVILFDNVTGTLGGGALDKVLTCTNRVSLRVLGKSEQPEMQWRAMIMATGNNAEIGADTARRVLLSRLEPLTERPEDRDPNAFKIPQLEQWCAANHPRLAVAALTLLRAYVLAGRPAQSLPAWGSFQPWADLVASAIVWAGGPNVLEARATSAGDEDEHTAALRTLLTSWPTLAPNGITVRGALDALYSADFMRGLAAPDGFDDLRQAIEALAPPPKAGAKPDAAKLGHALKRARGRVLGGRHLEDGGAGQRASVKSWRVLGAGR